MSLLNPFEQARAGVKANPGIYLKNGKGEIKMKRFFLIISIILLFCIGIMLYDVPVIANGKVYPQTGIVTEIEYPETGAGCFFIVTTSSGHEFGYYAEDGDWHLNDVVSMEMNDMGTPKVDDDEIIWQPKYSGTIDELYKWKVDIETAIYDELFNSFSEVEGWNVTRNGNRISIKVN